MFYTTFRFFYCDYAVAAVVAIVQPKKEKYVGIIPKIDGKPKNIEKTIGKPWQTIGTP